MLLSPLMNPVEDLYIQCSIHQEGKDKDFSTSDS